MRGENMMYSSMETDQQLLAQSYPKAFHQRPLPLLGGALLLLVGAFMFLGQSSSPAPQVPAKVRRTVDATTDMADFEREYENDDEAKVCTEAQISQLFTEMSAACQQQAIKSLQSNTVWEDSCACISTISEHTAATLDCFANPEAAQAWNGDTTGLVSNLYELCRTEAITDDGSEPTICSDAEITAAFGEMSTTCQAQVAENLKRNSHFSNSCPCIVTVPPATAADLNCYADETSANYWSGNQTGYLRNLYKWCKTIL